jgi:hypothetical protein
VHAGGRLCTEPLGRTDVVVTDAATADRAVAANAAVGATLVSVGRVTDPAVGAALAAAAAARGMPLVLSRQGPRRETPGLEVRTAGTAAYVPQLEAAARWTVDGLLASTDAATAAPFLPYARNFARVKGMMGRRIGRDVLRGFYGDRDPAQLEPDREQRAAKHLADGTCLASSGAGAAGLVPGLSLWAELDRLAALGGPAAALTAATGAASTVVPGHGLLAPGLPADLLLSRGAGRDSPPSALREGLIGLVVAGNGMEVATLAAEVEELVTEAMRERA